MSPWVALGIERTEDVGEIRRAYARKLKAIDPDADPEAFIALRDALNRALMDVSERQWRQQQDAISVPATEDEWDIPPAESAPSPDPADGSAADDGARFIALERLLFPGEGAPPPDPAELDTAVREILDHPDMAHVDRSASVEIWLAEILLDAVPRSDPVIPLVIDHFQWDKRAGQWDQPWLFAELVKRQAAFDLLRRVADPAHNLHKAYLELTSDKETLGLKPIGRSHDVGALLETIRQTAPAAESYLSPRRVMLWDERLNRSVASGLGGVAVIFWLLFLVVARFASVGGDDPSPVPSPVPALEPIEVRAYTVPEDHLTPMIRRLTGETLDALALAERNPALYGQLVARWEQARMRNEQDSRLDVDLARILDEAVRGGLRGGGYDVQAAQWRLESDLLKWRRASGVEACDDNGRPRDPRWPPDLTRRRLEVTGLALAAAPETPPPALRFGERHRFNVPGPVVESIQRETGLDDESLTAALTGRGTPAQRCNVRIALIDAALALPRRTAAPLLRELSAVL